MLRIPLAPATRSPLLFAGDGRDDGAGRGADRSAGAGRDAGDGRFADGGVAAVGGAAGTDLVDPDRKTAMGTPGMVNG